MEKINQPAGTVAGKASRNTPPSKADDESGQALVELALAMTIYFLLIVGAVEFARLAYVGIEVSNAARAGAGYGAQSHITDTNTTTIKSIALADAPDLTTMTATASTLCKCTNGVAITCSNASTTCSARVVTYVQVNTSVTIQPVFHLPKLARSYTLTGQAIMRVVQ